MIIHFISIIISQYRLIFRNNLLILYKIRNIYQRQNRADPKNLILKYSFSTVITIYS